LTSYSETLQNELIRDEGWRDKPYTDTTGNLTIGVGHNLTAKGLSRSAILAQLADDIRDSEVVLDQVLPTWRDHPDGVRRVLTNLAFNLGFKLRQFKHFLAAVEAHDYPTAASHLLSSQPWAKQVGQRANRLAEALRSVVK